MSSIGVIIGREFRERVMKKSFILTTILTPLLIVGLYVGVFFMMTMKVDSKQIMVIDRSGAIASELESGGAITYHPTDRTIESLREDGEGAFDGILVIGENVMNDPSDVSIYSYSTLSMEVEGSIASDIEKVIERHRLASYDIDNLPQIIEDYAHAWRTTCEIATFSCPCTYTDPQLAACLVSALEAVAGADRVSRDAPMPVTEDFSYVSEAVPSVFVQLGAGSVGAAPHHNPHMVLDESVFWMGAAMHVACACTWLAGHGA